MTRLLLLFSIGMISVCLPAFAVNESSNEFSRANLKKTLDHIQQRAHELQLDLDEANKERDGARLALRQAQAANEDLLKDATRQQEGIDNLKSWANSQFDRAEKATRDLNKMRDARDSWRRWAIIEGAAILLVIVVVGVLLYLKI